MKELAAQSDSVSHEMAQTVQRTAKLEETVSELNDDIDDTIEDFNILSDEMHRRWHKLLARQEHQRWEIPQSRHPDYPDEDEADGDD